MDRLIREGREYKNFRSATVWALERDRPDAAVRMAALGLEAACDRGEAQLALDMLRRPADLTPNDRGYVAAARTLLLVTQGDIIEALAAMEEARFLNGEGAGDHRLFLSPIEFTIQQFLGALRQFRAVMEEAGGCPWNQATPCRSQTAICSSAAGS
jgi:hypothetical protein